MQGSGGAGVRGCTVQYHINFLTGSPVIISLEAVTKFLNGCPRSDDPLESEPTPG